jgi:glycosyltransferase involved in cell wall biosynthesis
MTLINYNAQLMKDFPIITCVIATYRRPKWLQRAIYSALNQTFKQVVVFVTDNASGDETAELVRAIQAEDPRVIYHCQSENLGPFANWTYGLYQVQTPFYNVLNDDDVLLPEFYEKAYAEFQKHPEAMMVASKVPYVTDRGGFMSEPLSCWDRTGLFDPPEGAFRVAARAHPEIIGMLFRKELLKTPYGFPSPNIHGSDYEIIFQTCLHYPIVAIDYEGALFVRHTDSKAVPKSMFSEIENYLYWIRSVDENDKFLPEVKAANRRKFLPWILVRIIRLAYQGDQPGVDKALEMVRVAYGNSPLLAGLGAMNRLCYMFPPSRPVIKFLFNGIKQLKYLLKRDYPVVEKYRERLIV